MNGTNLFPAPRGGSWGAGSGPTGPSPPAAAVLRASPHALRAVLLSSMGSPCVERAFWSVPARFLWTGWFMGQASREHCLWGFSQTPFCSVLLHERARSEASRRVVKGRTGSLAGRKIFLGVFHLYSSLLLYAAFQKASKPLLRQKTSLTFVLYWS